MRLERPPGQGVGNRGGRHDELHDVDDRADEQGIHRVARDLRQEHVEVEVLLPLLRAPPRLEKAHGALDGLGQARQVVGVGLAGDDVDDEALQGHARLDDVVQTDAAEAQEIAQGARHRGGRPAGHEGPAGGPDPGGHRSRPRRGGGRVSAPGAQGPAGGSPGHKSPAL